MTSVEDYIEEKQVDSLDDDVEVKRESLAILASLGTTEEYLGVKMSLGNIKKLKAKDVKKYHNRYQAVLGKEVSSGLVESVIQDSCLAVSILVPTDDTKELSKDLYNDELVKRKLTNLAGTTIGIKRWEICSTCLRTIPGCSAH